MENMITHQETHTDISDAIKTTWIRQIVGLYERLLTARQDGFELTERDQCLSDALAMHLESIVAPKLVEPKTDVRFATERPNAIAPGHNPDNLTVEQVGDGWRLLDRDEVQRKNARILKEIEKWDGKRWEDTGWFGDGGAETYRTRLTREQLAAKRRGE